MTQVCRRTKSM